MLKSRLPGLSINISEFKTHMLFLLRPSLLVKFGIHSSALQCEILNFFVIVINQPIYVQNIPNRCFFVKSTMFPFLTHILFFWNVMQASNSE